MASSNRNNKYNTILCGQAMVGPPGSGKTTHCNGMQQHLESLGRNAVVLNLDPANEITKMRADLTDATRQESKQQDLSSQQPLPYEAIFDICEGAQLMNKNCWGQQQLIGY